MCPTLPLILRDLGFVAYGGPLVAFAFLLGVRSQVLALDTVGLVRAFRSLGPVLGLSLGVCLVGGLSAHALQHGGFLWSLDRPGELIAWASFFSLWVSNIRLEIWTLDPLRLLDKDGQITDEAGYAAAVQTLTVHLAVHAALVVITVVLARLATA